MKLSILPPTSGTLTSTEMCTDKRDPPAVVASVAVPDRDTGAPVTEPWTVPWDEPSRIGCQCRKPD